jgi:hypothetical protein
MPALLSVRSPAAIARLVISVIVNAIDGQMLGISVGSRPIAEDLVSVPFVTDANAATAIAAKGFAMRIITSRFHPGPNAKEARFCIPWRIAMSDKMMFWPVYSQTAA